MAAATPLPTSEEDTAFPLTFLWYSWITPLIDRCKAAQRDARTITVDDLLSLPESDKADASYTRVFLPEWDRELTVPREAGGGPSLVKAFRRAFGAALYFGCVLKFLSDGAALAVPIVLRVQIQWITDYTAAPEAYKDVMWQGYLIPVLLGLLVVISSIAGNASQFYTTKAFLKMRTCTSLAIYDKATTLSCGHDMAGRITQMHGSDTSKFVEVGQFFQTITTAVPMILGATLAVYFFIGPAAFVGLATALIGIPPQLYMANVMVTYKKAVTKAGDLRMQRVNEFVQGIRIIKFMNWETQFEKSVDTTRQTELENLRPMVLGRAGFSAYTTFLSAFISFTTFASAYAMGSPMRGPDIFAALAMLAVIRVPLSMLSFTGSKIADLLVVMDRIQSFLLLPEIKQRSVDFPSDTEIPECPTASIYIPFARVLYDPKSTALVKEPLTRVLSRTRSLKKKGSDLTAEGMAQLFQMARLEFRRGELTVVIGATASGKSTLINAIVGEAHLSSSSVVYRRGTLAYVAQEAWIMNDTVRKNVLMDKPYDEQRYKRAVLACQLKADLEQLPGSDETEIGERGINLSGGQKQRLALARAVYADADVVLMDDPLSAVDPHVCAALFHGCVRGALAGKTRVLVTHQQQFLRWADRVIVLAGLDVVFNGTYAEMQQDPSVAQSLREPTGETSSSSTASSASDEVFGEEAEQAPEAVVRIDDPNNLNFVTPATEATEFEALLINHHRSFPGEPNTEAGAKPTINPLEGAGSLDDEFMGGAAAILSPSSDHNRPDTTVVDMRPPRLAKAANDDGAAAGGSEFPVAGSVKSPAGSTTDHKLMSQEATSNRHGTSNPLNTYKWYINQGGAVWFALVLAAFTTWRLCLAFSDYTLTWWATRTRFFKQVTFTQDQYCYWYAIFIFASGVFVTIRILPLAKATIDAGRTAHRAIIKSLLHAPVAFYDTTPAGRILSRVGKDLETMDVVVPELVNGSLKIIFIIFGAWIIQAVAAWFMPIVYVFTIAVFVALFNGYLTANHDVRYLDSVLRSPVMAIMNETLGGLATLRAYNMTEPFKRKHALRVENMDRSSYCSRNLQRWLGVRTDALSAVMVSSVGLIVLGMMQNMSQADKQSFLPQVSLALTTVVQVPQLMAFLTNVFADLVASFSSVERLQEYAETLDQERTIEYWDRPDVEMDAAGVAAVRAPAPPAEWPHAGAIDFEHVFLRYRPGLDLVLKDVSFRVGAGEKVGVVGRTGSGKSTIMLSLFRIIEVAKDTHPVGNRIVIDGVDIAHVKLSDLRSKITIIPQDPLLFQGTVRSNLDPFHEHADDVVWRTLEKVHMRDRVLKEEGGLDCTVTERGQNMSAGERQLLCLARALLKNCKVLLLDEATASIDPHHDQLVQDTIRTEFRDRTVLTIAHRLGTVIDSDKVLVLDAGTVLEYGSPHELLQRRGGAFASMVHELGAEEEARLTQIAHDVSVRVASPY